MTASVDATGNAWGVTNPADIHSEVWDRFDEPTLGQVVELQPGTPAVNSPVSPAPAPIPLIPVPTGTVPQPLVGPAAPLPAFTGAPSPASSSGPPPPVAYVDPATGNYYVELTVCVSGNSNQPVSNDTLTLTLNSGTTAIESSSVTTGSNGCFNGDVGPNGSSLSVRPTSVTITDPSGGNSWSFRHCLSQEYCLLRRRRRD